MDAPAAKRRRLDEASAKASSASPSSPPGVVGLPAELWANVLGFAYLDEVQSCAAASKFFLNEVTGQLKALRVRSGGSMDVTPPAVGRFRSVTHVFVYLIRELEHGVADFHLDYAAMKNVVPFLSGLPKLEHCDLGRRHCYDLCRESQYDEPDSNRKWAELIQVVCTAYRTGRLSKDVEFYGLMSDSHPSPSGCAWQQIPKIDSYRDDVPCQICDMVCTSFPPLQVLGMCDEMLPCIEFKNIAKIIRYRDEEEARRNMTGGVVKVLDSGVCTGVMCPPDYVTRKGSAALFYDYHFDRIKHLIANGADPKHPSIVDFLLDRTPHWDSRTFVGRRRLIDLGSYEKLEELGLDMNEEDFITVSDSDERTSIYHFEGRKARSQLKSGMAISKVVAIREIIMSYVDSQWIEIGIGWKMGRDSPPGEVVKMLEDWMMTDLSGHGDEIAALFKEFKNKKQEND